jgi:hypothetical protein
MDPTLQPNTSSGSISPYNAPNSPYAASSQLANMIAALKGAGSGTPAAQQQAGGAQGQAAAQTNSAAPPTSQQWQQLGQLGGQGIQALGGAIGNAIIPSFTP